MHMNKKWIFWVFPLFALASCNFSKPAKENQALRINIVSEPQSLDPRKARELNSIAVIRLLFEGLTRVGKGGEIELALAESIERSEDGLNYAIRLREAKWSNGESVSSEDFAYSWKTLLDPKFPSDLSYQLYPIKGAKAARNGGNVEAVGIHTPDSRTLVVELEEPTPYFLELLSFPSYLPVCRAKDGKNPNWAEEATSYISNGAFTMSSWKHGDSIELKRNPGYLQAEEIRLDRIELCMVPSDTELRMFRDGKVDWAGSPLSSIPVDAIDSFKSSNSLNTNPLAGTAFLRVNTLGKDPLDSPLFRRALAAAIDRRQLIEKVLRAGQSRATTLVPPSMGLEQGEIFPDGDREAARRDFLAYLEQQGKEPKDLAPVELLYAADQRNQQIAQTLQQQIEGALGISIRLVGIDRKIFFQRVSQKNYQLAIGSWIADFNDPINFLEVFKYREGGTNNTGWEHPKYIERLNSSALCKTQEERMAVFKEAEALLLQEMPIVPLFHYAAASVKRECLANVQISPIGQVDFCRAYFESGETR